MSKKKTKSANPDKLKDLGISEATVSILTRQKSKPLKLTGDTPKIHDSVLKMMNSQNAIEKGERESAIYEKVNSMRDKQETVEEKIDRLMVSNKQYFNTTKLDHEKDAIKMRKQSSKKKKVNIEEIIDENQKAYEKYSESIDILVKPTKPKKKKVLESQKNIETEETDFSKIFDVSAVRSFSMGSSTTKGNKLNVEKGDYISPSSQHFARELGWIEDDRPKRVITSPLQGYADETDELMDDVESLNDTLDIQEEMDLKTIKELERKYHKEADLIRKEHQKLQNISENSLPDLSSVYEKIIQKSDTVKLSRTKNRFETEEIARTSEIDISKIPTIALEEQKTKKN